MVAFIGSLEEEEVWVSSRVLGGEGGSMAMVIVAEQRETQRQTTTMKTTE